MFLFNELIFLLPLIIYACMRIARLIPGRLGKIGFTVFFIFVVTGYPVAETLSHDAGPGWTKVLILAGYYCLPFMLYLVLIVILSDFVIAALRLLNVMSRETAGGPPSGPRALRRSLRSTSFSANKICRLPFEPTSFQRNGPVE